MKNVLVKAQEYQAGASAAEKGILSYLLMYPEQVSEQSVHSLSALTFSSVSTIMRLCRKLGFNGYKDFQRSLIYELAVRKDSGSRKIEEIQKEDSLGDIVDKVVYKNIASLENTRKILDLVTLEQCVNLLLTQKSIYLFGVGASLLVAKDLYLKFLRIDKQCYLCDDLHAQYVLAQNIHKNSVAIMISYSGMTKEMIVCAERIKKAGAPLILISRFEDSPLARISDYHLCVASSEYLIRSGAMSSRITQLTIVDILYTAYINSDLEHHVKKLQETSLHK